MRRWRIVHTTSLTYDGQVRAAHNELRMTPVNEAGQTTLENRIRIRPMTWSHVYRDHWGTHVMAMESLASHGQLEIEAISTVERTDVARHTPSLDWAAVRDPAVQDRSYEWLMLSARTRPGDGIAELVDAVRGEDAWAERSGVCQDFAHITVGALRSLGLPARYVSGYLVPVRDTAVGETSKGESHAWVEYWDGGWTPVDPTNGTEVGVDHVVVARGRDYEDVPPFKGIYSGRATASLGVVVAITRLA